MSHAINCNSCGAANQIPTGRDSIFCEFCGTSIVAAQQGYNFQPVDVPPLQEPTTNSRIDELMELATTARVGRDFATAVDYYNQVLELDPLAGEASYYRAWCFARATRVELIDVGTMVSYYYCAIGCYHSDADKVVVTEKVIHEISTWALAEYRQSTENTMKAANADGAYTAYIHCCTKLIKILQASGKFDESSREIAEAGIKISLALQQPLINRVNDKKTKLSPDKSTLQIAREAHEVFLAMQGKYDNTLQAVIQKELFSTAEKQPPSKVQEVAREIWKWIKYGLLAGAIILFASIFKAYMDKKIRDKKAHATQENSNR